MLSLGGIDVTSTHVPVNKCFIACYSHVGFVECKPHWLSELGDLGSCPLGGSVKCWGTRCVVQTLHCSRKSWELEFSSQLCGSVLAVGFIARVCYQFWYKSFLSHPMCRSHSANFWISLRENCSMCGCVFGASMGGGILRSFLCRHLCPESLLGSIWNTLEISTPLNFTRSHPIRRALQTGNTQKWPSIIKVGDFGD